MTLSAIFGLQGTIGPLPYLISGLLAFGLKYSIDLLAASLLVHRPWLPWQYLNPLGTTVWLLALGPEERKVSRGRGSDTERRREISQPNRWHPEPSRNSRFEPITIWDEPRLLEFSVSF